LGERMREGRIFFYTNWDAANRNARFHDVSLIPAS
jgi:hypothetical protein